MSSSSRPCSTTKCDIAACAVCFCCQNNLCVEHLKEHQHQLNVKLDPLTSEVNTLLDRLDNFSTTSSPIVKALEQWRVEAYRTVDQFCERMSNELLDEKKLKSQEKLQTTRNILDQLIRKQGATRENIDLLNADIRSIEQEFNDLQTVQINFQPLVIDEDLIILSSSSNRKRKLVVARSQQSACNDQTSQIPSGAQNTRDELQTMIDVYKDFVNDLQREIQDFTERLAASADEYKTLYRKYVALEHMMKSKNHQEKSNSTTTTLSNEAGINEETLVSLLRNSYELQQKQQQQQQNEEEEQEEEQQDDGDKEENITSTRITPNDAEVEVRQCPMCFWEFPQHLTLAVKKEHIEHHFFN